MQHSRNLEGRWQATHTLEQGANGGHRAARLVSGCSHQMAESLGALVGQGDKLPDKARHQDEVGKFEHVEMDSGQGQGLEGR